MRDLFGRYLNSPLPQTEDQSPAENYTFNEHDNWLVDERTPQIQQPKNFAVDLMPYQKASIYTMNQMELYKTFTSKTNDYSSCAGILSNDMGSGKTATILGLITFNPIPSHGPNYPISVEYFNNSRIAGGLPRSVVLRRYKVVFRPALVFVGYGVLSQWAGEVVKFNPHLRFFTVDGIHTLKKFYDLVHTKQINNYDLILIKNKTITGDWEFTRGEIEEGITDFKVKSIYNVIAVICRNMCFTRLIIDDFDTIGVPPVAGNINSLFTWFLSSTKKMISRRNWINTEHTTVDSFIHNNNIVYADITKNMVLYSLFNVHVAPSYYKTYASVGRPQFFYYKFANPSGKVLDLINCMAGDKVSEIMEALNGDAIGEAARLAGIEASDPNQIFKALLQKNYENMAAAKIILDHFQEYFNKLDIEDLPPFSENPDQNDTYTRKDLRMRRTIAWRYPGIRTMLEEEEQKWETSMKECTSCLDKFKASVKTNECLVCCCPLDDEDENYAILPCCNEIIHADCAVRGCDFHKENVPGGAIIVGKCPFDKSHRVLLNKLCYIKGGFDLTSIDESKFSEAPAEEIIIVEHKNRTKYCCIMDIIRGVTPPEQTNIHLRIAGLMEGKEMLPDPAYLARTTAVRSDLEVLGFSPRTSTLLMKLLFPTWTPKVLIFANFDETLDKIEDLLKTSNVSYARLGGQLAQITDQIARFKNGTTDHLLIKGEKYCASMNLQEATDLIFAHHIKDASVRSQVSGRLVRAGRTTNARIHFIAYDNEIGDIKKLEIADVPVINAPVINAPVINAPVINAPGNDDETDDDETETDVYAAYVASDTDDDDLALAIAASLEQ